VGVPDRSGRRRQRVLTGNPQQRPSPPHRLLDHVPCHNLRCELHKVLVLHKAWSLQDLACEEATTQPRTTASRSWRPQEAIPNISSGLLQGNNQYGVNLSCCGRINKPSIPNSFTSEPARGGSTPSPRLSATLIPISSTKFSSILLLSYPRSRYRTTTSTRFQVYRNPTS